MQRKAATYSISTFLDSFEELKSWSEKRRQKDCMEEHLREEEEEASNRVLLTFLLSNLFSNSFLLEIMDVLFFELVINLEMLLG